MKTMIENFVNGNLSDAKRQAKRYKVMDIFYYLRDEMGYSWNKARCIAIYLKNPSQSTYQMACNAV